LPLARTRETGRISGRDTARGKGASHGLHYQGIQQGRENYGNGECGAHGWAV